MPRFHGPSDLYQERGDPADYDDDDDEVDNELGNNSKPATKVEYVPVRELLPRLTTPASFVPSTPPSNESSTGADAGATFTNTSAGSALRAHKMDVSENIYGQLALPLGHVYCTDETYEVVLGNGNGANVVVQNAPPPVSKRPCTVSSNHTFFARSDWRRNETRQNFGVLCHRTEAC